MVELMITCPFCGREHSVFVHETDYICWTEGELAQNAFPYLSPTEREQIISAICPTCQRDIFGEQEKLKLDNFLKIYYNYYIRKKEREETQ